MSKKGELSITAYEFYRNVFRLKDKELIQELINETEIRRLKKGEHIVHIGEVQKDVEGVEVIEKLGRNIAWMLKVIDKAGIEPPETHHRTMFNYIR